MRTRVKICGITRVEDGIVAARLGADAIGLVFWARSPRNVAFEAALKIVAAMPPLVTVVGLFVDPESAFVRAALDAVPVSLLQFHGNEPADFCRGFGRAYVKAIPVAPGNSADDLVKCEFNYPDAAGFLFDAPPAGGLPGGTGRTFDWDRIPKQLTRSVILSGGLDAANVREAVRRVRPWAVDVSSGVEASGSDGATRKGIKDPARIGAFIEEVRHADV